MIGKIGNIHLRQSFKGIWVKLLLLCLAIFVFEILFSIFATSAHIYDSILRDMNDIPPVVEKMFNKDYFDAIVRYGMIAFGYLHPFMLIILIIFIFMAVSQMVTSEISSGAIGFTLGKPVSRKRLYFNLGVVIYAGLGCLALSAYASSALGILLFHSERLSPGPFASLAWNLFLLMTLIAGCIVVLAVVSDTGKKLYTYGGVALFVFYILEFATPLWKPLKIIQPLNPFAYYKPMMMLMGHRVGAVKALTLLGVSVILFTVGAFLFNRRDISSG